MTNFESPDDDPQGAFDPANQDNESWAGDLPPDTFADSGIVPEHEHNGPDTEPVGEYSHLLSEARMQTLAEPDPTARAHMAAAMITEGDYSMAEFAHAALQQIPDRDETSPDRPNYQKITAAENVLDALAHRRLFDSADQLIGTLNEFDHSAAIRGICRLVSAGYGGPDGAYLQVDFDDAIDHARLMGHSVDPLVFTYLQAQAAYGADILDADTPAGQLYAQAIAVTPSQRHRDSRNSNISNASAETGHVDNAMAVRELIVDPAWKGIAGIKIAEAAHDDEQLLDTLLPELQQNADEVRANISDRNRINSTVELDARRVEAGIALVAAKNGYTDYAKILTGELHSDIASHQVPTYVEIYNQTGSVADRAAALSAISRFATTWNAPHAAQLIRSIATADQQQNRMMPSLEADDEYVPLICWEISAVFNQKSDQEKHSETNTPSDEAVAAMKVFGIDPTAPGRHLVEARGETRDHVLVDLMRLTRDNAPKTTKKMLDLIQSPVEKVRAMTMLSDDVRFL
jgi:protein tyrosine/serine phosphatase